MAKQINVGYGGAVKTVKKAYIGYGGAVKEVKKGVCGYNGAVKEFFVSDLVLWDGSSLQNGATWSTNEMAIAYSFAAGSLANKNLVVKTKSDCSTRNVSLKVEASSGATTYSIGTNGYIGTTTSSANSDWKAGTEYVFPFSSMSRMATGNSLTFRFRNNNTSINITTTVAYVAIR